MTSQASPIKILLYFIVAMTLGCISINSYGVNNHHQAIISQGDRLIHADIARSKYGLDGDSINIAVISDSFNCLGTENTNQASSELPADIKVLQEGDCKNDQMLDEGRAMLEVIHDLAPKAKLIFHAMGNNSVEFSQALNQVADNGAQIIVDDAVFFHEPMFQDSVAAQTIEKLVFERGIAYFSSSGNAGQNSYQAAFSASQRYPLGIKQGLAHNFNQHSNPVDTCQSITVGADIFTIISLQWDQPIKSIDSNGSASDLDLIIYDDAECKKISTKHVLGGTSNNLGADPIEVVGYDNQGNQKRKTIGIQILLVSGPPPNLLKYILSGSSLASEHPAINQHTTPHADSSAFGHANANGAFIVGAVEMPLSGQPIKPSYYSSKGGVPILFNQQGQRLTSPLIRNHVNAVAPTNVNTSFFSPIRPDLEKDGYPNFTGTSAAAPHAAAVAALVLQAASQKALTLKPTQLYELLELSSLDLGEPNYDFATGYGLIQADQAIELLQKTF